MTPDDTENSFLTYRGVVYPWQCDHMDHLNVMWYVSKFDEATWQLFAQIGMAADRLRSERRGMAAVEQHLKFHRELHAGDAVSIRSRLLGIRRRVIVFEHRMSDEGSGELAAEAEITGVHIDADTRRATPLPEDVVRRGERLVLGRER